MNNLEWMFLALQVLMGIAVWFLQTAYSEIKDKANQQDRAILDIRENYFKKEDWKDFRNELWNRLDKMEASFEKKIQELKNES